MLKYAHLIDKKLALKPNFCYSTVKVEIPKIYLINTDFRGGVSAPQPSIFVKSIVKPIINWALSNSLNAYDRHSDWHRLTAYATKMSICF